MAKAKKKAAKAKSKVTAVKKPVAKPKASAKAKPQPKAKAKAKAKAVTPSAAKVTRAPAKTAAAKATKPSSGKPAPGDRAPSFALPDQAGVTVSSASLAGKPYVLYFYPKDDTPGCTTEACGFRDSIGGFSRKGVRVIGVSPDSEQSHARFAGKYGLPFTLLSDPEKQLCQAYGVWVEKNNYGRKYMGVERSTFVIAADGTVQSAQRGVRVAGHVESVLAGL